MEKYTEVAVVTLLALLTYFWMMMRVGGARGKSGIKAPAMTGDDHLERNIRVHLNTLEGLPLFLPSLWLFAAYWDVRIAAIIGLIWIVGRIVYALSYVADPGKRGIGFMIQGLSTLALLLGALGHILWGMTQSGTI